MHIKKQLKNAKKKLQTSALAAAASVAGTSAMAAGSDSGIEAGLYTFGQDLNTILSGAGGFVFLIIGVIVGIGTLVFTGSWRGMIAAAGGSAVLGYAVTSLSSFGGVTASTDLLAYSAPVVIEAEQSETTVQ